MKTDALYIGIDVSKKTLHVGSPTKFIMEVANDAVGHQKLIERFKKHAPVLIVLEASGGYERMVTEALQDAGLPVSVCQPSCVRHFARSINVLAKTDAIDAKIIARFGAAVQPRVTPKTPENVRKIRALVDRRTQVVEDRVRESNRLETCADAEVCQQIEASIQRLMEIEDDLEYQIQCLMHEDRTLSEKTRVLMQMKGIGPVTARTLLGYMPELGSLNRQQAAALAGLAPHPRESGKWKGRRRIYGGRPEVRKAMYMAARTASIWCPVISEVFQRLIGQGKPYKVAIIACARKMLAHANTLLKKYETGGDKMPA